MTIQTTEKYPNNSNYNNDVIIVKKLKKYYGNVKAVDDLTFSLRKGEIYGLLGPNGAGKSTTIKSIMGILGINEGEILVLGIDPLQNPEEAKEKIGYVAEETELYESLTVKELLNFVASLRRMNPASATMKAREYLKSLDALKYYNSFIGGLSRGNKQKIQIIAALLHDPEILILDEPLSGLDASTQKILKEIFQIHLEKGGSIIFSTHIMEQAQSLCDRIGIINNGKMIAEGTFNELQDKAQAFGASLEDIFMKLTGQDETAKEIINKLKNLNPKIL
ncbi:MAG: ABC transporter ATP-binding protein [Candidatus Hodarchaeales archaeon]